MATADALLQKARREAGLTQAELAARAGTTQSVVSAYESGHRQPAIPTLAALVDAAGSSWSSASGGSRDSCAGCQGRSAAGFAAGAETWSRRPPPMA